MNDRHVDQERGQERRIGLVMKVTQSSNVDFEMMPPKLLQLNLFPEWPNLISFAIPILIPLVLVSNKNQLIYCSTFQHLFFFLLFNA
jgi:hypothetical protein